MLEIAYTPVLSARDISEICHKYDLAALPPIYGIRSVLYIHRRITNLVMEHTAALSIPRRLILIKKLQLPWKEERRLTLYQTQGRK